MSARRILVLAGLLSLTVSVGASSQTQVIDRNDIVGATTLNWGSHVDGTGAILANPLIVDHLGLGVSVGGSADLRSAIAGTTWTGGFLPGDYVIYSSGATVNLLFSNLITGFATQIWYNFAAGGLMSMRAFRGGEEIFLLSLNTGGGVEANNNQATLFGLTDGTGFDRIEFAARRPLDQPQDFAFNQLTLSANLQTVVPEPATMVLVASGLVGLLGAGHLRRRRV